MKENKYVGWVEHSETQHTQRSTQPTDLFGIFAGG